MTIYLRILIILLIIISYMLHWIHFKMHQQLEDRMRTWENSLGDLNKSQQSLNKIQQSLNKEFDK